MSGERIMIIIIFIIDYIDMTSNKIVLELFSGTGSIGKVARSYGFEVLSLDLIMDADIKADILTWDYKQFPPNYCYYIHASPPCVEYSIALTTRPRNLESANAIVFKNLRANKLFKT
jgi:hypothetical protein